MTQETEQEVDAQAASIRLTLTDEKRDRILRHARGLEQTQVPYLWPLVLGILAGLAVPLGLLFASL